MSGSVGIRLVVADLNGTLLDDEKQLNAGIADVIEELAKHKIMFTLASGHNIHIVKPYLKELSLQLPFIANSGASMLQGDVRIYEKSMGSVKLAFAFQQLQQQSIPCTAYTDDVVFTTSLQNVRLQFFLNRLRRKATMKQAGNDRDMLEHAIFKVVMVVRSANVMEPVLHTINVHCGSLHAVRSEDDACTITRVDAIKGRTLVRLMELLQVQPKQTMVFGDNFNDVTISSESGICVCMENGQPEVKGKIDYITKANTEQGVNRFLKEHVLG